MSQPIEPNDGTGNLSEIDIQYMFMMYFCFCSHNHYFLYLLSCCSFGVFLADVLAAAVAAAAAAMPDVCEDGSDVS